MPWIHPSSLLMLAVFSGLAPVVHSQTPPARLALLVGCTKYQHPRIPELYGPANDVPLFAKLLAEAWAGWRSWRPSSRPRTKFTDGWASCAAS